MLWQKVGSRPYRYLAHAKPSWSMIISWGEVWGRDLSVCSQLRWPHQGTLLFCHPCACVRHTGALADKLSGCMLDLIPAGGVGFQRRFRGAGCIVILSIPWKIKPGWSLNILSGYHPCLPSAAAIAILFSWQGNGHLQLFLLHHPPSLAS